MIRKQSADLDDAMGKAKALLDEVADSATKVFGKKVTRGDILGILSGHVKGHERANELLWKRKILTNKNIYQIWKAASILGSRLMMHEINLNSPRKKLE